MRLMVTIARYIVQLLADLLASLVAALSVRWLLGMSNPYNDWRVFVDFISSLDSMMDDIFSPPDYLAGQNMAILEHMRAKVELGLYDSDLKPEKQGGDTDVTTTD